MCNDPKAHYICVLKNELRLIKKRFSEDIRCPFSPLKETYPLDLDVKPAFMSLKEFYIVLRVAVM